MIEIEFLNFLTGFYIDLSSLQGYLYPRVKQNCFRKLLTKSVACRGQTGQNYDWRQVNQ